MADATKEFIKAAKAGDLDKLRDLLATNDALIHCRDSDGSTALHCATWKGHQQIVTFLIDSGADVNLHSDNEHWGTTPLHAAAHANHAAIAQILIANGADVFARDKAGRTALEHTEFHKAKAVAKILENHEAR